MLHHLGLSLPDEDVRAPIGAHVERLVACVQDEYLMHVPRAYQRDWRTRSDLSPVEATKGLAQAPSARHRALDRRLLLGGEGDRRRATLDVLDIDSRVVTALNRGHDGPRPRGVEEGKRGR